MAPYKSNRGQRGLCHSIVSLVIGAGFSILVTWLTLRPHKPRYYVDYASLSQLNITDKILNDRMEFNVTARNPNGKMGIYYHKMEWSVYYEDERIATGYEPPFHQGHKNTTFLRPVLTGHNYVISKDDIARDLGALDHHNSSRGTLQVKLKLHAKIRFKVWFCKSWIFKLRVQCDNLYVNFHQNNSHGGNSFNRTACNVHI